MFLQSLARIYPGCFQVTEVKRKLLATLSPILGHSCCALRHTQSHFWSPFLQTFPSAPFSKARSRVLDPTDVTLDSPSIWDSSERPGHQPSLRDWRRGCYCLLMCTFFAQITTRSNEPTAVWLLSLTLVVKNDFPVEAPLVRVLFLPLLFRFPGNHHHLLAQNLHMTPVFGVLYWPTCVLGRSFTGKYQVYTTDANRKCRFPQVIIWRGSETVERPRPIGKHDPNIHAHAY